MNCDTCDKPVSIDAVTFYTVEDEIGIEYSCSVCKESGEIYLPYTAETLAQSVADARCPTVAK